MTAAHARMRRHCASLATCFVLAMAPAMASPADPPGDAATLDATIAALDDAVFAAFNRCADPAQLQAHARYFAPDVEFYHDTGGVSWTREAMIANTARYACGHYTRERVSLRVSPVRGFGAIAQGVHRFCQVDGGRCEGEADFVMVWRLRDGQWQVTRVLSYGHRPSAQADGPGNK